MRKKVLGGIGFVCLILMLFLFAFGRSFPSYIRIDTPTYPNSFVLNLDDNLFYRQTLNNCGPYSVMAVINVLKSEVISPELLAKEMRWRMHKNLTFPIGLIELLHRYGIRTTEYILNGKTSDTKIHWIKETIAKGSPIIMLIKINHVQHYVTVLGYDEHGFMLYDSLQKKNIENGRKTFIDEGCLVGNRYYSHEELIDLWNNGGYKIFFKNWAIVCNRY